MDVNSWTQLMGRDLERAVLQPLQPVRVGRDRAIRFYNPALRALGFSGEDRLIVEMRDGVSPEPRLATYHLLSALRQFGLLERLRGQV